MRLQMLYFPMETMDVLGDCHTHEDGSVITSHWMMDHMCLVLLDAPANITFLL
jgi:hypothetical protein